MTLGDHLDACEQAIVEPRQVDAEHLDAEISVQRTQLKAHRPRLRENARDKNLRGWPATVARSLTA